MQFFLFFFLQKIQKPKKTLKSPPGGQGGGGVKFFFTQIFIIFFRSPCKNLKPYDNPFWDFNNGGRKKEKRRREKKKRKEEEKKSMIIVVPSSDRLTAWSSTLRPIKQWWMFLGPACCDTDLFLKMAVERKRKEEEKREKVNDYSGTIVW